MFKINLVPEAKKEQRRIQKMNLTTTIVVTTILAILAITILVLLGIRVSSVTAKNRLEKNITKTEKELVSYKELEETVVSLQNGLKGIEEISKSSSKWSKFFSEVEKAMPQDVAFERLVVKDGNKLEGDLKGKNIDSLARFVQSFKDYKIKEQSLFKNIDVSGYEKDDKGEIKFNVKMELQKEVLWP